MQCMLSSDFVECIKTSYPTNMVAEKAPAARLYDDNISAVKNDRQAIQQWEKLKSHSHEH